ncbi:MAG: diguanylate cyclase [Mesotoga sp.]|uniref:sensor domain-containing diguanylate cyclase n=1 Tax=Mesotoga sp. TaxID=2053577 RepID=UPI00260909D6|nr:diguanylate cyclase [Mesotoga sp.]MDD4207401.1 diguanylate cyclase [Mesotoga sp.]MDD4825926.1 diguanylate cyclase [Mesotoga sp.]
MGVCRRDFFASLETIFSYMSVEGRSVTKLCDVLTVAGKSLCADRLAIYEFQDLTDGSFSLRQICEWKSETKEIERILGVRNEVIQDRWIEKIIGAKKYGITSEKSGGAVVIVNSLGTAGFALVCEDKSVYRDWTEDEKAFLRCLISSISLSDKEQLSEEASRGEEVVLKERLLRNDELLKNFEGNVLDILAVADKKLIFTYVSPSVVNTMGFTPEELVGTKAFDLIDRRDVERVIEESKELAAEKKHGSFRYRTRTKGGRMLWMETAVSPLLKSNEIEGWTMSSRDVTSEVKLQAELRTRDSMMIFMNDLYVLVLSGDNLHEAASKIVNRAYEEKGIVGCRIVFSDEDPFDLEVSRGNTEIFPVDLEGDPEVLRKLSGNHILLEDIVYDGIELRYVCIALESNNEVIGAFESVTERVTGLTEESIDLYRLIGTTISLSLNKIKNFVTIKRNHITSESLRKATEAITKDLNMNTVIESIVGGLRQVIPFYSAAVELIDGDQLLIVGGSWPGRESFLGTRFTMEVGSPGHDVVKKKRIVLAEYAQKKYHQFNKPDFAFIKSWMGVPLLIEDEPIGMIAVDSEIERAFRKRHLEALKAFADIAAIGINNARLHEEVRDLSIRDYLTGVYNRRGLFELGEREIEKAKRYGTEMGLIMFDVDNFKKLNDKLGHLGGDYVLKRVAQICCRILRAADIFGRYGGDEFIVILPMTDSRRTEEAALRILRSFRETNIEFNGIPLEVSASLGIAGLAGQKDELEEMIKRADNNLYVSKSSGGDKVTGGPESDQ